MGLAERRVQKEFQDNHFPKLKGQLETASGTSVPLEVNWETLAPEGQSHLYLDAWTKVYFEPTIAAFQDVCRDQMGKDALKEKLKKIVMQNTKGTYYGDRWASFEAGVLTLDHEPCTNVDDVAERTKGLVAVLEKAL